MKSAPIVVFATLGLVLISGTLLAGPKQKTNAGKKTYTGTVTDTVCGTKHMMKDMDDGNDVDFPFLMGQVAAVINDVKPAKEIVDEMIAEAVEMLKTGKTEMLKARQ